MTPSTPPARRWRRYPEYRDSGVEWLGAVPVGWDRVPLLRLAINKPNAVVDGPFGSSLKNDEYQDEGVPLIQLNNILPGAHSLGNLNFISIEKSRLLERHEALPGDIVIAKMADPVARAALVSDQFSRYVIVADCIRMRPDIEQIEPKFAVYAMNAPYFQHAAESRASGTTRLRINLGAVRKLELIVPPLEEQRAIAAFLDRETAKIDDLVAKKERLIELLEEKRAALITRAVTRGLDPDVPMKDSGVEWLGKVPGHWERRKMAYVGKVISGGTPSKGRPDYWQGDIPWVSPKDMKSRVLQDAEDHISSDALEATNLPLIDPPAVLIVVRGMILAHTFPVALATSPLTINQDMKALKLGPSVHPEFFVYFLEGIDRFVLSLVEESGHGTKKLRTDLWKSIPLHLPPYEEQRRIVEHLDRSLVPFIELISWVQQGIARLREYRAALISAAVTGRIDVREESGVGRAT